MINRAPVRQPAAVLFVIFALAAATPQMAAAAQYSFYYQGRPVQLDLDTSRIAVMADSLPAAAALGARSALPGADVKHYALDAWYTLETPAPLRSDLAVEELVADVSAQPGATFVSPVFYELGHLPLVIVPQLLVRFDNDVTPDLAGALLAPFGRVLERDFGGVPNLYLVQSDARNGFTVLADADSLRQTPGVVFAEPDRLRTLVHHLIPNDPYFSRQWALHNTGQTIDGDPGGVPDQDMDGPEAWNVTLGSGTVRVGILDVGMQTNHPDLNVDPNLPGASFTGGGTNGNPETVFDNHGTAVAGCTSAVINNATGVVGVAPGCRVVSVKIGRSDTGDGTFVNQPSWTVSALNWCQGNDVKITNSSWGGGGSDSESAAFATARVNGLTHFASAGNDGTLGGIAFPANLPTVNCISGVTRWGVRWESSDYGGDVDFAAPAEAIWTTDRTGFSGYAFGDYSRVDGTSFSSPYAAGVAALVLSRNPTFTPSQIELVMRLTSVDRGPAGYDIEYGWGFVNAAAAVNYVASAPGAFNLLTPASNASGVSTNATFTWSAASAAESYTLTIDSVATFDSVNKATYTGIVGTNYTLTGNPLLQQTTYHWKIDAVNAFGQQTSTPASRAFTTFADCDGDDVHDPDEILANPALDCNNNGRIDSCDLATSYGAGSLKLFPFGAGQAIPQFALPDPRDAASSVSLQFWAVGDLNAANEYVDVSINGTVVGRVFEVGALDCAEVTASLLVPAATFNTLRASAGGTVTVTMTPSPGVNPAPAACTGQVYIRTSVAYTCVPFSIDANSNGIPDECEQSVQGDQCSNAIVIAALPYSQAGNTCAPFSNDYDSACPSASSARDVVYQFTPAATTVVNIDTCAASYDSKLYLYQGQCSGSAIACSDNACGTGNTRARLDCLQLLAGQTYYIVVDGAGSACGDYTLNVSPAPGPGITCPQNISVPNAAGQCGASVGFAASGSGGCTPLTLSYAIGQTPISTPHTFPVGTTAVTATVTDAYGRTASCNFDVTVNDAENPAITCPQNLTLGTLQPGCSVPKTAIGTPTTADNCSVASVGNDAPANLPPGVHTITWTVTDTAGRTATCQQQVTVIDDDAPSIDTCPPDRTLQLASGQTSTPLPDLTGEVVASDNCDASLAVSQNIVAGTPLNAGVHVVTLTVTDDAALTDTCEVAITVEAAPAGCLGDTDCDGDVDFFDIDPFVARIGCPGSDPVGCAAGCGWQNADVDSDGDVDFFDIDPFVARIGSTCP